MGGRMGLCVVLKALQLKALTYWCIRNIVSAFEHVSGSHSGKKIKKQYDQIVSRYGINDKIYKIVADQAANMKKAFAELKESTHIVSGACEENIIKITQIILEKRRQFDIIEAKKEN